MDDATHDGPTAILNRPRRGRPIRDLTGRDFGRWHVVRFYGVSRCRAFWLCRCRCGTERPVAGDALTSHDSRSCGCSTRFAAKHGSTGTPTYETWLRLRRRHPGEVDARWSDFSAFVGDVGEKPSPRHRLVRFDRRFPFRPGNVAWAAPTPIAPEAPR